MRKRDGLHYPEDRTQRFAVVSVTEDFSVKGIIEKPTSSEIEMNRVNGRAVRMNVPFPICEGGTQEKGVFLSFNSS